MNGTRRGVLLGVGASICVAGDFQRALGGSFQPTTGTGDDIVRQVSTLVHDNFYDSGRTANFDEAVLRYKKSSGGSYDYKIAIKTGLNALEASHNEFYTPAELDYYELLDIYAPILIAKGSGTALKEAFPPDGAPRYDGVGIAARRFADGWYISDIYDASPAQGSSLKVGDVVLTADGLPFDPITSFRGKSGRAVTLTTIRTEGGEQAQVKVNVISTRPNLMMDESITASVKTFNVDGAHFGYMRLWTYSTPDIQEVVQHLLSTEPLSAVSGLILDMRCRRGGAPPDAADTFVGVSPELDMTGRSGKTVVSFRYRKPLVGLIDGGTRSGMEVLAYTLKKAGVPLIGSKTEGAVLGGTPFFLEDHSLLSISVMNVIVDGRVLEGVGVSPDFEVPYRKLYTHGHDPQLEEAVNQVVKQTTEKVRREN